MEYNLENLHRQVAGYFKSIRISTEPQSLSDLEPQLSEFDQLINAKDFDAAAQLLDEITNLYLTRWGLFERIVQMRKRLINNIKDQNIATNNFIALADTYRKMGNTDTALKIALQAQQDAKAYSNRDQEGKALAVIGATYRRIGKSSEAIQHLRQALIIARELQQTIIEIQCLLQIGQAHCYIGQLEQGRAALLEVFYLADSISHQEYMGEALGHLGNVELWLGHTREAMEYYEHALDIAKNLKNQRGIGYWFSALGEAYLAQEYYEQAKEKFEAALQVAEEIGDNHLESYAGSFLAQCMLHMGDLQEALNIVMKIEAIPNPQHNDFVAMLYALILARLDRKQEALAMAKKAQDLGIGLLKVNNQFFEAHCTNGLVCLLISILYSQNEKCFIYLGKSQKILMEVFEDSPAKGQIDRFIHIMEEFRPIDQYNMLPVVKNALHNTLNDTIRKTGVFIELHVNNFEIAIKFYSQLGFVVTGHTSRDDGYLTMRRRNCVIHFFGGSDVIYQHPYFGQFPASTPVGVGVEIIFPIDEIDSLYDEVQSTFPANVIVEKLTRKHWGERDFRLRDPFGYYLRFTERINWLSSY